MSGTKARSDRGMSNRLAVWLQPFGDCFTVPTWRHVLVLIAGAILSPGWRTVAAALRVVGLEQGASFTNYHRVLNRNSWSSRRIAGRLLQLLVSTFVPDGPVIIGLDDTLERRWGSKIKARGIYRDPVRSSHGHFVKASGLRWLCVMAAAYSLGWPRLGSAIPNRPGSFRAIRATAPAARQEAHRLGSTDLAADRAMVARAANHRRH